jgi:deazaflavin-dependent oxidoreductase (nitroreductase family)
MRTLDVIARQDASHLYGAAHVRAYRDTDGDLGHDWRGAPILLLTTTGRHSGEPRTTPLIYGVSGDDHLVVASNGGSPDPPGWFQNLSEQPEVEVQVLGDRFRARARTATADEKPAMWREMVGHWPAYDDYTQRTDRDIPVVVLERV